MSITLICNETPDTLLNHDQCDKYDYLAAVGCGAVAGLIDIFLVGSPADSKLQSWTDAQVDKCVMNFSRMLGWNPRPGKENSIASAIGFLENKFSVNYDQRHSGDIGGIFNMSAKNHHMKSLAHSPDIVGLFFSILNQFTSTSTFLSEGQLITINTEASELVGGNLIAKLFCGVANWFGHIMSDIAGSSGGRGNAGRGSGVCAPFYELFSVCNFGRINISDDPSHPNLVTLGRLATRAFEEGYDARYALTAAIPVITCDLSIRLIWSLRRYFQMGLPLRECIPSSHHDSLRTMLLFGNATLCVMDGIDAAVRSGGNWLAFFMRLNLVAWGRMVMLVFKEICIRLNVTVGLEKMLESFKRINEALCAYLHELEKIDIETFKRETEEYNQLLSSLSTINDENALSVYLNDVFEKLDIQKPWQGDFDDFMSDTGGQLVFE